MQPAELYNLWAPDTARWSDWAKPVLFTQPGVGVGFAALPDWRMLDLAWARGLDYHTAVVLDVPDAQGVLHGLALAARGFRPVPLYNGTSGPGALVDVGPIVTALHDLAQDLDALALPDTAPPVFLLDAKRWGGGAAVQPGRFDNRWAVFPQDFPSANFLRAHDVDTVLLGQFSFGQPQPDLAHVLRRWQEAGLRVLGCDVQRADAPEPLVVARPARFRSLWYRALVLLGLRRNSAGGFGAVVPQPSQSSGYG